MKRFAAFLILWVLPLLSAMTLRAAEITLVYPRTDRPDDAFVYPDNIDTTFVLGRIEPPQGELRINGQAVRCTERGAFLAWLPLRKAAGQREWHLSLLDRTGAAAELRYPYLLQSDFRAGVEAPDTLTAAYFPRVLRVVVPNAHARTAIGGSYFLFPDSGCRMLALGHERGFFRFDLGDSQSAVIEDRFVALEADTALPAVMLGSGECGQVQDSAWCVLALPRPVLWSADLTPDGRTLVVTLRGVQSAVDRIHYHKPDGLLQDVAWDQQPAGLRLEFRCRSPLRRGYDLYFAGDSLRVHLRAPSAKGRHSLKGKTVVVDAGHGGTADGAIGPLGTKEKDVTLRWAKLLEHELHHRGAHVVMTRLEDVDLGLYERSQIARRAGADFFVSLHANALPDGRNPFVRHGASTYYYQGLSRRAAEVLHHHLLRASDLRDDGLHEANFAVVRPTAFPSVLIEGAYLIYPAEEELLQSEEFLRKLARGLARGIGEYYRTEP